ncbi:50S ribosomal protein L30 [Acidithiobacillus caldus]|uniref:50S ribosomal protein L30 n=1 Tax=Acidithiobacillus caldus TaxID=33059 RepID=UPI001C06BCFF|nr:50S ribosomal protein L30 [Acidithiobacillus caldus]MBU2802606.1 50S ribosomal protein L30 [Acidithiobacillus caldus]
MTDRVRVTLVRSLIGVTEKHRATVRGIGLRHTWHSVERDLTPELRGMLAKVPYLLRWEVIR